VSIVKLPVPLTHRAFSTEEDRPPVIPALPKLTHRVAKAHRTYLDPNHPLEIPASVVTAKPHLYWFLGTVGFALFVKWVVHKTKSPAFTPGEESEEHKKQRLEKVKRALVCIAEFEAWAKAQKKSGIYDEKKLEEALGLAGAVKQDILDNGSVDAMLDNGRKRFPLIWNMGAGMGINLFDFLFLLPLLPVGVGQWVYRKAEDAIFPPKLWNSDTSLALLGEQVQDCHVLLPASLQPSWWQRQNYYRQRSRRMWKPSGRHIDPREYRPVLLFAADTDHVHEHKHDAEHAKAAAH
jgi:hypothetical protein